MKFPLWFSALDGRYYTTFYLLFCITIWRNYLIYSMSMRRLSEPIEYGDEQLMMALFSALVRVKKGILSFSIVLKMKLFYR
nr:MAG TPA: hypothetical protein [Caudoviricetes sp.]